MNAGRILLGKTSDIPPGTMKVMSFEGEPVLVANTGRQFHAVSARCTHEAEPLVDGYLSDALLVCAYHGSEFDLLTGEAVGPPAEDPLTVYDVTIEGHDIWLAPRPEPRGA